MDLADIVNTNKVLKELSYQNDEFNLFKFFDNGKSSSVIKGACGFITRKQSFYCFSPSYHSLVFENVASSIFDDGNNILNVYYDVFKKYYKNSSGRNYSNDAWRYANAKFGLVSIQLLSKNACFVWCPEVINSFQKEKIIEFYNEMKEINKYLESEGFSVINVDYIVMKNGEYSCKFNGDEFISQIDSFVSDNCFVPYENDIKKFDDKKRI